MDQRSVLIAVMLFLGAYSATFAQPFTLTIIPQDLPAVKSGDVAWGDVDNDGDLDLFLSGIAEAGRVVAGLYRNDGVDPDTGRLRMVEAGTIEPFCFSSIAWGDYDGDGDLDLALIGSLNGVVPYVPVSRLYRNEGGILVRVDEVDFIQLHSGAVAWGDVDNDGDLDLLISGSPAEFPPFQAVTRLYRNAGDGTFTDAEVPLTGLAFGTARFADYDGDGDLDLIHTGANTNGFKTQLYRNDTASGILALNLVDIDLPEWAFSDADFGDYDRDGDLDLLINGAERDGFKVFSGISRLYRNDGGDQFSETELPLVPTLSGGAQWGDYDNDGDLDLLVMGAEEPFGKYAARVYRNSGDGTFNEQMLLVGLVLGRADWADYDRDGDLDLITIGRVSLGSAVTALYRNDRTPLPQDVIPEAPTVLPVSVEDGTVTLAWEAIEATRPALQHPTYNLYVWNETNQYSAMPAHADPATGLRRIAAPGNVRHHTTWTLSHLEAGRYQWGVQAVSGAFVGSRFTEGGTFIVEPTAVGTEAGADLPATYALHPAYPNPFTLEANIRYDLPKPGSVRMHVYDVLGRHVQTLVEGDVNAGVHTVSWQADHVGAGVYFLVMEAGGRRFTQSVLRMH